jgi:ADP-heptose:LPS heptosyltransferase
MLAKFRQGGLQQNKIAQLLVKYGVASRHESSSSNNPNLPNFKSVNPPPSRTTIRKNRFCEGKGSGKLPAQLVRLFIFKPDGIGDFVLVTGALRLLAAALGEANLLLCVRSVIVPLARSQFPGAIVIELPTAAERKTVNLFARNLFYCLPLWFKLRTTPVDAAVCFRSMRNYLETFLFYSAKAKRFFACENLLLRPEKKVRRYVETGAKALFRPDLAPYPEKAGEFPLEIEAHRRVAARILDRAIEIGEVLPVLRPTVEANEAYWICAPVTEASKMYPFPLWTEALGALKPEILTKKILLVGSGDQRAALSEIEELLKGAGIAGAAVHIPSNLVDFLNLIGSAELVLTVDTAAAHFATALDKPCVVLFSGLHRGMFGPWQRSARQRWLLPEAPPGKTKFKWHAGIPPGRVAAEVRELINFPPQGAAPLHTSCSR